MGRYNYVDSCRTYQILLEDSGLLPKPNPSWNTFTPVKGMVAHVDQGDIDYGFDGEKWIKLIPAEEGLECYFDGNEWVNVKEEEQHEDTIA